MTFVELDEDREVWTFEQVRAYVGRISRPDGRPVSRGTVQRLIDGGLPVHRLNEHLPRSRQHFYADEVRGFVGNRWNRPTPAHRGRKHTDNGER